MNQTIQLGKRLSEIAKLITNQHPVHTYDQIWDCCCDHGYLGIHLLKYFSEQSHKQPQINFIDQVPHITEKLRHKLEQSSFSHYQVLTHDVAELEFDEHQGHCIIIAGVTANGLIGLLDKLLAINSRKSIDLVLCPARGIYDLRQFLIKKNMQLIDEAYVLENNRHYEIVHVRFQTTSIEIPCKQISSIGEFWQKGNNEHITYLKTRIDHFRKETNDDARASAKHALVLYSEKLIEISSDN